MFLSERHPEEGEDDASLLDAELEVMIAGEHWQQEQSICIALSETLSFLQEPQWRKRGLAMEALSLLIYYTSASPTPTPASLTKATTSKYSPLSCNAFLAKIGFDNQASIQLFEKLGFQEFKRSQIWKEIELRPSKKGLSLACSSPSYVAVYHYPLS